MVLSIIIIIRGRELQQTIIIYLEKENRRTLILFLLIGR
nr:MAG TPA: hypothetical protein [Caudoviricetes sp.]